MRILGLATLFLGLFYYVLPRSSSLEDVVEVKQSSVTPVSATPRQIVTSFHSSNSVEPAPSVPVEEEINFRNEPLENAEKVDLEPWQKDIRDYLLKAEPQDGEEIFYAFLAEKEAFQSEQREVMLEKENIYRDPDGNLSEALYQKNFALLEEYDYYLEQITQRHQDRLRQILGAYFDEVSLHHHQTRAPNGQFAGPVTHEYEYE